jgi:hypothetical protein
MAENFNEAEFSGLSFLSDMQSLDFHSAHDVF